MTQTLKTLLGTCSLLLNRHALNKQIDKLSQNLATPRFYVGSAKPLVMDSLYLPPRRIGGWEDK